ncbi:MAG: hypothetical protein OXG24_10900 [Gammaproteobacteria bacterium]|nr:hypothetical protein [Gammaproteobacteria bacterium]
MTSLSPNLCIARNCSIASLVAFCLLGFNLKGDEERVEPFQSVEIADGALAFTMPEFGDAVAGSFRVGNSQITVELHEENIKLKATTGTVERVQWVSETDEFGRFIYNEEKKRFERLTHSVRIVMEDYEKLNDLVEETDAKGGKAFPDLDFAIVNLPKEIHPLDFSKRVEEREDVKSASIEVETPKQIPL